MGGLNAPSSKILLLLKHNNCLAGMEKTDCFCYRYPNSSLSEKKIFQFVFGLYKSFMQQLQNSIYFNFFISTIMICPK